MVEALDLQLDALRKAPPSMPKSDEVLPERERLMAEFLIEFNGRQYFQGPYRYDSLSDAVNYARLGRANAGARAQISATPAPEQIEEPSESQRLLMNTLGITFLRGVYQLGAYRYDRLADAVAYARLDVKPLAVQQVPERDDASPSELSGEAKVKQEIAGLGEWLGNQGLNVQNDHTHADEGSRDRLYLRYGYFLGLKHALRLLTNFGKTLH